MSERRGGDDDGWTGMPESPAAHAATALDELDPSARNILALLAMRPAGPFMIGRGLAAMASWMERIAMGWLAWELTQSAGWLGTIVFLRMIPAIVVSVAGGIAADRRSPIVILRVTKSVSTAFSLALLVLALSGQLSIGVLALMALVTGAVEAFSVASGKSAIWHLVPVRYMPVAVPVGSVVFNLAGFAGPALAGALLALSGPPSVFAISAAVNLSFVVIVLMVPPVRNRPRPRGGIGADIAQGAHYVRTDAAMRTLLMLHLSFSLLVRPVVDLLPGFVAQVLDGGAALLGVMTSAVGAGAIVTGIWLAARSRTTGLVRVCLIGAVIAPVALVGLALAPGVPVALACLLILGGALVVRAAGVQTLLHLLVDPDMRGRLMGLHTASFRVGSAVGALSLAFVAELIGFPAAFALTAALALLMVASLWRPVTRAANRAPAAQPPRDMVELT